MARVASSSGRLASSLAELDADPVPLLDVLGEPRQRLLEAEVVEDGGAEIEGERARLDGGLREQLDGLVDRGARRAGDAVSDRGQLDLGEGERLTDAVVELEGDPSALALLAQRGVERHAMELVLVVDDPLLVLAALGDVGDERHDARTELA